MIRRRSLSRPDVLALLTLGTLVAGSLLPAVAQFREAAARSRSSNNLKQIVLAIHNYNDANRGKLPPLVDVGVGAPTGAGYNSLFFNILPYIEQDNVYRAFNKSNPETYYGKSGVAQIIVNTYISPADDTAMKGTTSAAKAKGPDKEWSGAYATTSYAANGLIPWNTGGIPRAFTDGTSNTIAFAERPQVCKPATGDPVYNLWAYGTYGPSTPAYALATPKKPDGLVSTEMAVPVPLPAKWSKEPVKIGFGMEGAEAKDPPAGAPFQIGQFGQGKACDPRLPGTPHANGMLVAMVDGSVRALSPKISQYTFWAATTPAGGETLGSDW
jgi:hypothetical protein